MFSISGVRPWSLNYITWINDLEPCRRCHHWFCSLSLSAIYYTIMIPAWVNQGYVMALSFSMRLAKKGKKIDVSNLQCTEVARGSSHGASLLCRVMNQRLQRNTWLSFFVPVTVVCDLLTKKQHLLTGADRKVTQRVTFWKFLPRGVGGHFCRPFPI